MRFYARFRAITASDNELTGIALSAAAVLALRVVGFGASFLFSIAIARLISTDDVGIYYQAFAIVSFSLAISQLGMNNALLRFVSTESNRDNWPAVAGLARMALNHSAIVTLILTLGLIGLAPVLSLQVFNEPRLITPLQIMALALLPLTAANLYASMLRGVNRPRVSMLIESVSVQVISLGLLFLLAPTLGVVGAVSAYVIATIITLIGGRVIWRQVTPALRGISGEFDRARLYQMAWPLLWVAVFMTIHVNIDTVLMGVYYDSETVGIYGVSRRMISLLNYVVIAFSFVTSPRFAVFHSKNDRVGLRRLAQRITILTFLLAVPLILPFVLFPEWLMGIYGAEYVAGAHLLPIMAVGQFVNIATGTVGDILMMSGHEKDVRNSIVVVVILDFILGLILIPMYGMVGGAMTVSVTLATLNIILVIMTSYRLKFSIIPFMPLIKRFKG